MAGAGCLLGCENMLASAAASAAQTQAAGSTLVASGDACASSRSHDCCAGKKKHAQTKTEPKPDQVSATELLAEISEAPTSMRDCPLAVNATAALTKLKRPETGNATPASRADQIVPNVKEQASSLSPPLRLPNRGHTYLRCCVFLI